MSDLTEEKIYRTGKNHKSYISVYNNLCGAVAFIPEGPITPFPNCTPHKNISDVHLAYRMTLSDKWANDKRPPKWTKRTRLF